jgi:hypothetical protein
MIILDNLINMKKIILILITFLMFSCNYTKDRLVLVNKTGEKDICYSTYLISCDSKAFYEASAGGEFGTLYKESSPLVRTPILDLVNENSLDKTLYIVLYKKSEKDFVFKNGKNIPYNKRFKTLKYTLNELNNLNWIIEIR